MSSTMAQIGLVGHVEHVGVLLVVVLIGTTSCMIGLCEQLKNTINKKKLNKARCLIRNGLVCLITQYYNQIL